MEVLTRENGERGNRESVLHGKNLSIWTLNGAIKTANKRKIPTTATTRKYYRVTTMMLLCSFLFDLKGQPKVEIEFVKRSWEKTSIYRV